MPEREIKSYRQGGQAFSPEQYRLHPDVAPGIRVVGMKSPSDVAGVLEAAVIIRYGFTADDVYYVQPTPSGAAKALEKGAINKLTIPAYTVSFLRPHPKETKVREYQLEFYTPNTHYLDAHTPLSRRHGTETGFTLRASLDTHVRGMRDYNYRHVNFLQMTFVMYQKGQAAFVFHGKIENLKQATQATEDALKRLDTIARRTPRVKGITTNDLARQSWESVPWSGHAFQGGLPGLGKRR